jgi:hypothetical protein
LIACRRLNVVVIRREARIFEAERWRSFCQSHGSMPFEIVFGRWLALCAHPICAWRGRGTAARILVVTSYFAAGYLSMLTALLVW